MAVGAFFWLDRALLKIGDGTLDLDTQAIKMALLTSSQAVARSFVGSSGDALYADLTGEVATGNGYTLGGVTLTAVALSRPSAGVVRFASAYVSWTPTGGGITCKYAVLYVSGAPNKDLLMVCDLDDTGGSITATSAGPLVVFPPSNGYGQWIQA